MFVASGEFQFALLPDRAICDVDAGYGYGNKGGAGRIRLVTGDWQTWTWHVKRAMGLMRSSVGAVKEADTDNCRRRG